MKILGPNDSGKGILVEWDAGIINPNEPRNQNIIQESYGQLEHSKPFVFYLHTISCQKKMLYYII